MTTTADQRATDPIAAALDAARNALASRVEEINDLNVFPVADGDTGTNMLMTLSGVAEAAMDAEVQERAAHIARAALLAAKGNSGMILSQLVRGAAETLADIGEPDGGAARRAFRGASDAAYAAVREPVEGTMLTVARRMAEAAERAGDGRSFAEVVAAALAGGWSAVEETTDLLPQLAQAKVVDSGGLGLAVILDGVAAHLEGRTIAVPAEAARITADANEHAPSRFRYCTTFVVEGDDMDLAGLESALAGLGDSLLVMGDARQAKVHVHTDEPARAGQAGEAVGVVTAFNADDMREQEAERAARIAKRLGREATAESNLIAVVGTEQLARIAAGLGAAPVRDATTLRESLGGSERETAVVVAHGRDAEMAREIVAEHGCALVEAPSIPAALACLVAFDGPGGRDVRVAEMVELAAEVRDAAIAAGVVDHRGALQEAISALADEAAGLFTVLIGEGVDAGADLVEEWVREVAPGAEVEAHRAGLTEYDFLIGAE